MCVTLSTMPLTSSINATWTLELDHPIAFAPVTYVGIGRADIP
jgi:hypothetical protein